MESLGGVDRTELVAMFVTMTRIMQCDERIRSFLTGGQIHFTGNSHGEVGATQAVGAVIGGYYSPRGHEAISAGVCANLRTDDYLLPYYRGLHDQLGKGVPMRGLWSEFLGRATGVCKGKGGSMHIADPTHGVILTTVVVGSGLPIANGLALASQMRGEDRICVVNFGDGASNIGAFHEALNLASLWRLPVIFVCQNNQYALTTPFAEGTSVDHVAQRGASYGIPGLTIDGNDPIVVYQAAHTAVARARKGEGPTLIEAVTYRLAGHSFGDGMEYMPASDRAAAALRDPVLMFRKRLVETGIATEMELRSVEQAAKDEIDDAVAFALASPPPPISELLTDVYAQAIT